jgi:hypothetical protein
MSGYVSLKDKAKAIRGILKTEFPTIKFSVRKSGGSAINISYNDGVPSRFIKEKVQSFESIDRCEYSGEILLGGNDYIFVNREITDENRDKIKKLYEENAQSVIKSNHFTDYEKQNMLGNVYSTTDFSKPLTLEIEDGSIMSMLVGNMGN